MNSNRKSNERSGCWFLNILFDAEPPLPCFLCTPSASLKWAQGPGPCDGPSIANPWHSPLLEIRLAPSRWRSMEPPWSQGNCRNSCSEHVELKQSALYCTSLLVKNVEALAEFLHSAASRTLPLAARNSCLSKLVVHWASWDPCHCSAVVQWVKSPCPSCFSVCNVALAYWLCNVIRDENGTDIYSTVRSTEQIWTLIWIVTRISVIFFGYG
jgi:hypothetical protein